MSSKFTLRINADGFDDLVGDELIGFKYIESMSGCARWAMNFDTQDNRRYDSFIKRDEEPFTIRFGTEMFTDGPRNSNLKTLRLLQPKKRLMGEGRLIFNFKGTCGGVALQRHRAKDKHWKDRRISEIVDELIADVGQGLFAKVAKTDGKFSLMGCNLPTGRYIKDYLLPLAYSQAGKDWGLWVEDGKTVYFDPELPTGEPYRFTNLYRDDWFKMKSPEVIKDTRFEPELNTGKIEVMMYDADQDRLIRREVDENTARFNYQSSGRPIARKKVSRTKIVNMQRDRQTDLRPYKLLQQMSETIWSENARGLYTLISEIDYEPGLTINRPAIVDLSGPFGIPDVNTGKWTVHSVQHVYRRGDVKTWVRLEKRWER